MDIFERGTSNVVWCEAIVQGYKSHPSIAEFWNTTTSVVFFCIAGTFGLARAWRQGYSQAHLFSDVLLVVVGIGSAFFHATQSYAGELLDEVPMSIMAVGYLLCVNRMHWLTTPPHRALTYGVGFGLAAIAWVAYFWFRYFEIFRICFVFQVACPALISLFSGPGSPCSPGKRQWWVFLVTVLVGKVVWQWERLMSDWGQCPTSEWDPRFWFHPTWHFCAAASHVAWMSYSGPLQMRILKEKSS